MRDGREKGEHNPPPKPIPSRREETGIINPLITFC